MQTVTQPTESMSTQPPCGPSCDAPRLRPYCHCQACGETGVPLGIESGYCAACIAFEAAEHAEQRVDNLWTPVEALLLAGFDQAIPRCRLLKSFRDHAASGAFAHRCLCTACTYARLFDWPMPNLALTHWLDQRAERVLCGPDQRLVNKVAKVGDVTCPACRYDLFFVANQPGEPTDGVRQLLASWKTSYADVLAAAANWGPL